MAEEIKISGSSKEGRYEALLPQLEGLIATENDLIANLANITAALKETFQWLWVGFYLVRDHELVLGPFQGPIACTRIQYGKGVCGYSWKQKEPVIVPDVDAFPGHISCSSHSRSEIVLPAFKNEEVFLILDVDSEKKANFDETDKTELQKVINLIEKRHGSEA